MVDWGNFAEKYFGVCVWIDNDLSAIRIQFLDNDVFDCEMFPDKDAVIRKSMKEMSEYMAQDKAFKDALAKINSMLPLEATLDTCERIRQILWTEVLDDKWAEWTVKLANILIENDPEWIEHMKNHHNNCTGSDDNGKIHSIIVE